MDVDLSIDYLSPVKGSERVLSIVLRICVDRIAEAPAKASGSLLAVTNATAVGIGCPGAQPATLVQRPTAIEVGAAQLTAAVPPSGLVVDAIAEASTLLPVPKVALHAVVPLATIPAAAASQALPVGAPRQPVARPAAVAISPAGARLVVGRRLASADEYLGAAGPTAVAPFGRAGRPRVVAGLEEVDVVAPNVAYGPILVDPRLVAVHPFVLAVPPRPPELVLRADQVGLLGQAAPT